jgi:hypothetical protein
VISPSSGSNCDAGARVDDLSGLWETSTLVEDSAAARAALVILTASALN